MNTEVNVSTHVKLAGKYRMVVKHADGTETDSGLFDNLILDSGLNRIGQNSASLTNYCFVGTSADAVLPTQTTLSAQIGGPAAGTSSLISSTNSGAPNYVNTTTLSYSFSVGQIQGTIAEVGIGGLSNGQSLFSRALIVDNLGQPTTITLLATDQLIVYYQTLLSQSTGDSGGTFVVAGVTYSYTMRAASIGALNSTGYALSNSNYINRIDTFQPYGPDMVLGPITGLPFGLTGSSYNSNTTVPAYVDSSYQQTSICTMNPTQGNIAGGIRGFTLFWGGPYSNVRYQTLFDASIPKTNLNQLTMNFTISWNR